MSTLPGRVLASVLLAAVLAACDAPLPAGEVAPLVTVEFHGGMCAEGECRSAFVIRTDGSVIDPAQPMVRAQANPADFTRLRAMLAETDLRALGARKFTGVCPVAFDGQEVVFTFRVPGGDVRLASCEVELDPDHPLFVAIRDVLRAAEGPTN